MNQRDRRDKIGRRIGRNWWREWITSEHASADQVWWLSREAEAIGYETEMAEFALRNPRPTLKGLLVANAGLRGPR